MKVFLSAVPYPSLGTLFKGRDEFLQQLGQSLERGHDGHATSIVGKTIRGLRGVGETRLAVENAWQRQDDCSAVLFVAADLPAALRSKVAELVGPLVFDLREQNVKEEEAMLAAALRWLDDHPGWFLIVDNVDTEEAAVAVEDLLAKLHGGQVLVTSRLARWSAGVEALDLDVLRPEDAARFLLERTAKRRRKLANDEADAAALARELDGLALALEQAAAYIQQEAISLADYLAAWLPQKRAVKEWHNERPMKYPHSLAVTWQTTIEQLDVGALALLRFFAWFAPDPVPLFVLEGDKAHAIWCQASQLCASEVESYRSGLQGPRETSADITAALATLADFSMLRWDVEADTVTVHRVVQEILRTRLPPSARHEWLLLSLRLLDEAAPYDADDVQSWPRWDLLGPHAAIAVEHGDRAVLAEPTARLMGRFGTFLHSKALYAEAEPLMRRALAIDEECYGPEHPTVATTLNNLASLLKYTNRLREAEPLYRRALAIDEQTYGAEHPTVAVQLSNLAQLLQETNRLAEAEPLTRRALAIDEQRYGPAHPTVATRLSNLASLLQDTNRLSEAEPLYRRALAIDEQAYGAEHPRIAVQLNNLAMLLQETDRAAEAVPLMRRALAIDERSYGPEHPMVAAGVGNLASLLLRMDCLAEAEPLMRRALAIDERAYGPAHLTVARDLHNLACLLIRTRRVAEAEPLMRRSLVILHAFNKSNGYEHPQWQADLLGYWHTLTLLLHLSDTEISERFREFSS